MPGFGHLPNDSGDVPVKSHKQSEPQVFADTDPDNIGDYVGGEVIATERTAESGSRKYSAFTYYAFPGTGTSNGAAVQLVGYDAGRARAIITNGSTVGIYLGPYDQINQGAGFLLPAGQTFEAEVQQAVFACIPAGVALSDPAAVGVWVETDS